MLHIGESVSHFNVKLDAFMNKKGISTNQLAKELGGYTASVRGYRKSSKIPDHVIEYLAKNHSLDICWFFGVQKNAPEIFLDESKVEYENHISDVKVPIPGRLVPVIDPGANVDSWENGKIPCCGESWFPCAQSGEYLLLVQGNNSSPIISHGDIISCRPIEFEFVNEKIPYIVVTSSGPAVKRILHSSSTEHLLISINPDFAPIKTNRIYRVFEIVSLLGPFRYSHKPKG